MYDWSELIKLWEHEQLTTEQVLGQLLRYGEQHHQNNTALQRQVETLDARLTVLEARGARPTLA